MGSLTAVGEGCRSRKNVHVNETSNCAAPTKTCGSPAGWRAGGRCLRCRTAHNAETNRYRGLHRDQRLRVLAALRGGASPQGAASEVGVSLRSLQQSAATDAELWAALDGHPAEVQQAAAAMAYLAALVRTLGDADRASLLTGFTWEDAQALRASSPGFVAAERATRKWLEQMRRAHYKRKPWQRASDESLNRAADVLEAGGSVLAAARAAGMSNNGLRIAAARHDRLRAAMPPISPRPHASGKSGPRTRLTPEVEQQLRDLWETSLPKESMCRIIGISRTTLNKYATRLELPPR